MKPYVATPQPSSLIGVGLRHCHYTQALSHDPINDTIDFVELHAENFFAKGGVAIELLNDAAQKYAISIHGTSLGLGSNLPVPKDTLEQFANVVQQSNAKWVSEHLCFNRAEVNGKVLHSGDLLPLAYNEASLQVLVNNIDHVQDRLKQPILIENLSAYISPSALSANEVDHMSEFEFLTRLCNKSGCGLLLDLNNLIVNALNQKQSNVFEHVHNTLKQIPPHLVGEIHLAGFSDKKVNGFIVDDHASPVSEDCWALYDSAKALFGNVPTLIEWDNNLPSWEVLVGEAQKLGINMSYQSRLIQAVFKHHDKLFTDANDRSQVDALSVYHNNYIESGVKALSITYRSVYALMDKADFRKLTIAYINSHPKTCFDWAEYGHDFSAYLININALASMPFLPELADVDWRIAHIERTKNQLFDAASFSLLQSSPPETLCFVPAPGLQLMQVLFPVQELRELALRVADENVPMSGQSQQQLQAKKVRDLVNAAIDHPSYKSIVLWREHYKGLLEYCDTAYAKAFNSMLEKRSIAEVLSHFEDDQSAMTNWLQQQIQSRKIYAIVKKSYT